MSTYCCHSGAMSLGKAHDASCPINPLLVNTLGVTTTRTLRREASEQTVEWLQAFVRDNPHATWTQILEAYADTKGVTRHEGLIDINVCGIHTVTFAKQGECTLCNIGSEYRDVTETNRLQSLRANFCDKHREICECSTGPCVMCRAEAAERLAAAHIQGHDQD